MLQLSQRWTILIKKMKKTYTTGRLGARHHNVVRFVHRLPDAILCNKTKYTNNQLTLDQASHGIPSVTRASLQTLLTGRCLRKEVTSRKMEDKWKNTDAGNRTK